MRFHRLGPMPVKRDGSVYSNPYFSPTLAADRATLAGVKSFDGHDLTVALARGTPAPWTDPPAPSR